MLKCTYKVSYSVVGLGGTWGGRERNRRRRGVGCEDAKKSVTKARRRENVRVEGKLGRHVGTRYMILIMEGEKQEPEKK